MRLPVPDGTKAGDGQYVGVSECDGEGPVALRRETVFGAGEGRGEVRNQAEVKNLNSPVRQNGAD